MGIKAIGFDLDGTLYRGWHLYVRSIDIGLRHPRLMSAFNKLRKQLRHSGFAGSADRPRDMESFRALQANLLAQRLGCSPAEAGRALEDTVYGEIGRRFSLIRPFRGVASCLAELRGMGLPLGILSDLPPAEKLSRLGLADYFDAILCSEESGALKPDAAPFLALADRLGVPPREILYVGNRRDYDILGAKSAGMRAALVSGRPMEEADFVFTDWRALPVWVKSRLQAGD